MKTTYTIIRYTNGWSIEVKDSDPMKNYNGVFEDIESENKKLRQSDSLANLLAQAFDNLLSTDDEGGLGLYIEGFEKPPEGEEDARQ